MLIFSRKRWEAIFFLTTWAIFSLQFPTTLQPKKSSAISQATETLRLHYVTERILASVLPPRTSSVDQLARPHSENSVAGFEEDEYERELITMLEQKHNKVRMLFPPHFAFIIHNQGRNWKYKVDQTELRKFENMLLIDEK